MESYTAVIGLLMRRELTLCYRKRAEYVNPLLFFLLVALLFPLATTAEQSVLHVIGPGIIWVAVLLAALLGLQQLFREDFSDGSLEQWVLSDYSLPFLIFVKIFAQWLIFSIPLMVISPLLALLFHFSGYAMVILLFSLLLGTAILFFLGSIGAALTVGLRNGGILLTLLLLPLYVPTLIFASSAVNAVNQGLPVGGALAWLGVLLILALIFAPVVSAFALRMGIAYEQ